MNLVGIESKKIALKMEDYNVQLSFSYDREKRGKVFVGYMIEGPSLGSGKRHDGLWRFEETLAEFSEELFLKSTEIDIHWLMNRCKPGYFDRRRLLNDEYKLLWDANKKRIQEEREKLNS